MPFTGDTSKVALIALGLLAVCIPLDAKLAPITLAEFHSQSPCGYLVTITSTRDFDFPTPPNQPWMTHLNRLAAARVSKVIGDATACPRATGAIEFLFSTEIHSSHPEVGAEAVVFLREVDGSSVETVYGRSYWRVTEVDGVSSIEVTWRNSFLVEALPIVSGEVAYLPFTAIDRWWRRRTTP